MKIFLFFILLRITICSLQINLHVTDWLSEKNQSDNIGFQHDCLHVAASHEKKDLDIHEIISYCLTDFPSKWNIEENNLNQKFTFDNLREQNITSQQLYSWSAPIDIIELYQLYLNQSSNSNGTQLYYNCTLPRFGSLCQYQLDIYQNNSLSLNEIIYNFYRLHEYNPDNLTCYIHLECNRGSPLACLDWTEICNGRIDCQNNAIDEENCWQIDIDQCEENEYRCHNGQCIDKIFHNDDKDTFECLDQLDEVKFRPFSGYYFVDEPTFALEDVTCSFAGLSNAMKLTSSCIFKRNSLLQQMNFVNKPISLNETCWLASKCHFEFGRPDSKICSDLCPQWSCKQTIIETCPDIYIITNEPLAFGHIYFAYVKNITINDDTLDTPPQYICYNDQYCDGFYSNVSLLIFNNMTCRQPKDFPLIFGGGGFFDFGLWYINPLYSDLNQCNPITHIHSSTCNSSTLYKCINSSKCISVDRLCDEVIDCNYKDDEQCDLINGICPIKTASENLFKCTNNNKCISLKRVNNEWCDCGYDEYDLCDDEISNHDYVRKHISFQTICDGFKELSPIYMDGENHTDESECQYWICNNTYTRCDGIWNCLNGADEVNCNSSSSLLKCPHNHHICVSSNTYNLTCLFIDKFNDGHIDCIGGTDEPKLCRPNGHELQWDNFYCKNNTSQDCLDPYSLCDGKKDCVQGDDEDFCDKNRDNEQLGSICWMQDEMSQTDVAMFLCRLIDYRNKLPIINFAIDKSTKSVKQLITEDDNTYSSVDSLILEYPQRCHRGIPLKIWLNNSTIETCLCPPSYYGNQCQYQNQRISFIIKFQTYSDSRRTLFSLIISLIDDTNQKQIHSYQQLTYLYTYHCQTKFNIYLVYSTRPKLLTNNFFIHINIYEKISFKYRGSFLIPVKYSFLPVNRIAVKFNIPHTSENIEHCSDLACLHGQCIKYINGFKNISFCKCDKEWSGIYCHIKYKCMCSSDSLCIGIESNNRSICICPLNKWGLNCFLQSTICQSNQCLNNGECIPIDENVASGKQFICNCQNGFSGDRCEIIDNKIIISFEKNLTLPESILVHFIKIIDYIQPDDYVPIDKIQLDNVQPENGSTYKTIPINQKSVTIQWSRPFHIAFIELFINQYYLITVQNIYKQSSIIKRLIKSSDRCKHINEILNETISKYHLIRRIKYYHLSCQKDSSSSSCFYDDNHFCLCNDQHIANCFEFNTSIKYDCFGESNCENNAQCLQDRPNCPQTSICICPSCVYGKRCQFRSSLFGLSLDAILGYYIKPNVNMKDQPSIVKVSIALTTIMFLVGFINGILSLITFKNKEPRKVGCGLYLFGSSITTLFTIIIFTLKLIILIISQKTYNTNRSFLKFQCHTMDFLLRFGLNMDQWLNACVAIERAFTAIKGINFNKNKSKKTAKYIIIILIILNILTNIHDPIHRRLLDDDNDDEEKRIWCIISYSTGLQAYNTFINMFHFFVPFLMNIISSIMIIVLTTQQRTKIEKRKPHKIILREQIQQHRQLLIAPIILIILAIPRLIISFISGCMKSTNNGWILIIGYFISFIPPMLTFLVFVIPSKLYTAEFHKSIQQYRKMIRIRSRLQF